MQMEGGRAETPTERWRSRGRSQEAAKREEKLLVKQAQEKRVSGEAALRLRGAARAVCEWMHLEGRRRNPAVDGWMPLALGVSWE